MTATLAFDVYGTLLDTHGVVSVDDVKSFKPNPGVGSPSASGNKNPGFRAVSGGAHPTGIVSSLADARAALVSVSD